MYEINYDINKTFMKLTVPVYWTNITDCSGVSMAPSPTNANNDNTINAEKFIPNHNNNKHMSYKRNYICKSLNYQNGKFLKWYE